MIISHAHRFVYLKTRKTAGSSVEVALSRLCQPGDVFTWLPKNYEDTRSNVEVKSSPTTLTLPNGQTAKIAGHMTYSAMIRQFGPKILTYRVITNERNPFDKLVSAYFYLSARRLSNDVDWKTDLKSEIQKGFLGPCEGIYSLSGVSIADNIIRYEHLETDVELLAQDMDVVGKLYLSERVEASDRPAMSKGKDNLREMFADTELQRFVRNRFSGSFMTMGYHGVCDDCPQFKPFEARQMLRDAWAEKLLS